MSKEDFMKIQTCVLKVNIHCDGCKHKVKKILQKIEGVFKTTIDSEQGKVTVLGNVNPDVLFKKLAKSGKHAELWGSSKSANNNQTHLANQFKNMQILDNNKNKEGQKGNTANNNSQPKGGQPTPQQLQQHLQHLQQMKGFQDLKLPQLKDMKMGPNPNNNNNQKVIKFAEEEDFSDDDDDYDEDDLDDDCDLDDDDDDDDDAELDDPQHPINKMKPVTGNTPKGMPNNMMMLNGNHPQLMNAQKGAQNGAANAGGNGKKRGNGGGAGGGNGVPVAGGNNGNGGKKDNAPGGNPNQGGGGGGKTGGKSGGGLPQEVNKNGGGNNGGSNGGKKGKNGAPIGVSDGFLPMGGNIGHQRAAAMNMAMGQVGSLPINQMGNIPAVQGLPAPAAMSSGGGYFQGAGPDVMPGNPYHQQQYMAAMMNQQRALGANQRFQPMMHARPPPTVNYIPPYPYPYPHPQPDPYLHPQPDPYPHFSDENTSGCNVI